MKFSTYSLRTGILAQLTILIISALLLISMALIKIAERDLIQAKLEEIRLLIQALEPIAGPPLLAGGRQYSEGNRASQLENDFSRLIRTCGFTRAVVIGSQGDLFLGYGISRDVPSEEVSSAKKAMKTREWSTTFRGRTMGALWFNNKEVQISAPLFYKDRYLGGITITASLVPLYQTLRQSQKLIILYIIVDTLILVGVGFYLLSRIVVKPIQDLLRLTDEYKEGDPLAPLAETGRDEIGRLNHSLRLMLGRLNENKAELKAHIASLEKANQDLKQAQNEIIRSEKMASVGRLSAGVAHEIGNPIGIVLGYLGLLRKGDLSNPEKEDFLERIELEIIRINGIIRHLLDFSRPAKGDKVQVPVHQVIKNTVNMLKPQPMVRNIQMELKLDAIDDRIHSDPNQLQQVFLNILMNSADALRENPVSGADSGEKRILIVTKEEQGSLQILIEDNGPGISEEDLDHIFDPFYTTKPPGEGTGLGLAVSYRIIEDLGGAIAVRSTEGKGTVLTITLPLDDESRKWEKDHG